MDAHERTTLTAELLAELAPLFRDHLAADHWGRLLVEVVARPQGNGVRVASLDVEDIFGDEALIDATFAQRGPRDMLPVLAQATETLASLANVSLEETQGGTFLQRELGTWAWLPGLIRTPSAGLENARDDALARLRERHAALPFSLVAVRRADVDIERQRVTFYGAAADVIGAATILVLGSFSARSCRWHWAWGHDSLPAAVKQACKTVVDELLDRDLWEISVSQFATDESTVWALGALLCDRTVSDGLFRVAQPEGAVYLLLRAVTSVASRKESLCNGRQREGAFTWSDGKKPTQRSPTTLRWLCQRTSGKERSPFSERMGPRNFAGIRQHRLPYPRGSLRRW